CGDYALLLRFAILTSKFWTVTKVTPDGGESVARKLRSRRSPLFVRYLQPRLAQAVDKGLDLLVVVPLGVFAAGDGSEVRPQWQQIAHCLLRFLSPAELAQRRSLDRGRVVVARHVNPGHAL